MQSTDDSPTIARFFRNLSRHPIFDYWLPAEQFDHDSPERIRAATFVLFMYVVGLLGFPLVYYYSAVHYEPLVFLAFLFGAAPAVVAPVLLKFIGRLRPVAHAACALVFAGSLVAATFGGHSSFRTGLPWLMVAPMYAAIFADRKGVVAWTGCAITALVGFYFAGGTEPIESAETIRRIRQEQLISTALLTVVAALLLIFQETLNDLLVDRLDRARRTLRRQATYDDLTGLPNRLLFRDRLQQSVRRARRRNQPVVVGFFDLDDFKLVNDFYGHRKGDLLLRKIADRVTDAVRAEDTLARLGGDEFVGIFEGAGTEDDVDAVADRIRGAFRDEFDLDGTSVEIDVSMGFAQFDPDDLPDTGDDEIGEILRKAADRAMYTAKAETGTRWQLSPVDPSLARDRRVGRMRAIEDGVEADEFVPHYQPIVRLEDSAPVGAEVLVRWEHPEEGLLTPDAFLNLAAEASLLNEVQKSVVRNIRRHFASGGRNSPEPPAPVDLFINLDPSQLRQPDETDELHELLQSDELEDVRFVFEITENDLLGDDAVGGRLRSYGYRLAVDDFGTGYSSLNRMTEIAVDCLKIDRSFVQRTDSETYRAIVRNIGDLGARLDVPVVGEGVETDRQIEFLSSVRGCGFVQGYYTAEPEPYRRFVERLEERPDPAARLFTRPPLQN